LTTPTVVVPVVLVLVETVDVDDVEDVETVDVDDVEDVETVEVDDVDVLVEVLVEVLVLSASSDTTGGSAR